MAEPFFPPFTQEQSDRLTAIWDRLYQLYLEKANGDRAIADIDAEIDAMIKERNAIRSWGWDTGRDWRKDIPAEVLNKPRES
jgi:hypothetical protein